jgi:hypothetical protein
MAGDSKIKHELVELAERSKDESLTARERLEATYMLGVIVTKMEALQELVNDLEPEEEDNEPKYVWRNGAKVKVK